MAAALIPPILGDGFLTTESNTLKLIKEVNLFYPTAFTPDKLGDVRNETFEVKGQFVSKIELSIFDRWGALWDKLCLHLDLS